MERNTRKDCGKRRPVQKDRRSGRCIKTYVIPKLNIGVASSLHTHLETRKEVTSRKLEQTPTLNAKKRPLDDSSKEGDHQPNKKFKSSGNAKVDLNAYRSDTINLGSDSKIDTHFKCVVDCENTSFRCLFSGTSVNNSGNKTSNIKEQFYACQRNYGVERGDGVEKIVIGCQAWLSDKKTLQLLRMASGVAIVVNREDYDVWGHGCVKKEYPTLPRMPQPMYKMFEHLGGVLSTVERHRKSGKSSLFPIRAFGNSSENKRAFGKRSSFNGQSEGFGGLEHCKYLVFFEKGSVIEGEYRKMGVPLKRVLKNYEECYERWSGDRMYPYYVWTGSMNLTGNAKNNHENAIFGKGLTMGLSFFYDFSVTYINSTPVFSKTKSSTPTITSK